MLLKHASDVVLVRLTEAEWSDYARQRAAPAERTGEAVHPSITSLPA